MRRGGFIGFERSSVCLARRQRRLCGIERPREVADIDPKRVFLLGYGHAGNSAILATDSHAAANHPLTFAGAVSYWPWCGWGTDFSVPTLVLIGEKDDWSSPGLPGDWGCGCRSGSLASDL